MFNIFHIQFRLPMVWVGSAWLYRLVKPLRDHALPRKRRDRGLSVSVFVSVSLSVSISVLVFSLVSVHVFDAVSVFAFVLMFVSAVGTVPVSANSVVHRLVLYLPALITWPGPNTYNAELSS